MLIISRTGLHATSLEEGRLIQRRVATKSCLLVPFSGVLERSPRQAAIQTRPGTQYNSRLHFVCAELSAQRAPFARITRVCLLFGARAHSETLERHSKRGRKMKRKRVALNGVKNDRGLETRVYNLYSAKRSAEFVCHWRTIYRELCERISGNMSASWKVLR